jgi:hypothetical protein
VRATADGFIKEAPPAGRPHHRIVVPIDPLTAASHAPDVICLGRSVIMASFAKRDDGSWRARYRDDAGKECARHFDRKIDAQRWLNGVTAAPGPR